MFAIALAFCSSICWGVSDFVGGLQARKLRLLNLLLLSQGVALLCLIVAVVVRGSAPPDLSRLLPAAAAGIGGMVGLGAFYRALAIGTMSIVAPISATGAIVPVVAGVAGGDRPSALQVVGILAAIGGVALASRERSEGASRRVARASVLLALVAALGFGCFFVGMRSSARADVLWALFAARMAGVAAIALVVAIRREAVGGSPSALLPVVLVGILDLSANGLYAVASRHGDLSEVAVAASLYPVATVLLARAVLGERVRRIQELGILAALAGVVLIAAG